MYVKSFAKLWVLFWAWERWVGAREHDVTYSPQSSEACTFFATFSFTFTGPAKLAERGHKRRKLVSNKT